MDVYVAAKIGFAVMISVIVTLVTILVGVGVYHIPLVFHTGATLLIATVLGSGSFAALGLVVAAWLPNATTVFVAANALSLPLLFASNIFIPFHSPVWLSWLPVKPLGVAIHAAMLGTGLSSARVWHALGLLLAWGFIATLGAGWSFRRVR